MEIIFSLILFFSVNIGIYFLLRFWKNYAELKGAADTLSLFKTYTEAQLLSMYKELCDEEIRLKKFNKFYYRKLNIKNAIELSRPTVMTHKERSLKFAEEAIYSLQNSDK
jgi:hypothetical protein